jgi:hypothetical protein
MNQSSNGRYNLITALAMIVGIVIGSGIFFKADNVLKYTNGNVALGVVVFVLAAVAIIFGSLSIAELAKRTDAHGGLIGYADEFVSPHFSTMIGWFQLFLYYPTLGVVVTWVVGIYTALLFGVKEASLELQMGIGLTWFVICYLFNVMVAVFAGRFQVFATIVKLIPLFVLGVMAFVYGDPVAALTHPSESARQATQSLAWLGAIGPIAFSFDGWVVSTSISGEIKHANAVLCHPNISFQTEELTYFQQAYFQQDSDQVLLTFTERQQFFDHVILCMALDTCDFLPTIKRFTHSRGQVTWFAVDEHDKSQLPKLPLKYGSYYASFNQNSQCHVMLGASFVRDTLDTTPAVADHQMNVADLADAVPDLVNNTDIFTVEKTSPIGRVAPASAAKPWIIYP